MQWSGWFRNVYRRKAMHAGSIYHVFLMNGKRVRGATSGPVRKVFGLSGRNLETLNYEVIVDAIMNLYFLYVMCGLLILGVLKSTVRDAGMILDVDCVDQG